MFKHIFKLMWNKRRSNTMIFLEILLAFTVLFAVYAFGFFNLERYSSPLGFSYENSLEVRLDLKDGLDSAQVLALQERIHTEVVQLPNVVDASFVGNIMPFRNSTYYNGTDKNGFDLGTQGFFVDEHYANTAELKLREGRWFTTEDANAKYTPILVNAALMEEYYPNVATLVDTIIILEGDMKVIGVVENFKYKSNFTKNAPLTFFYQRNRDYAKYPFQNMIVRTTPGMTASVE